MQCCLEPLWKHCTGFFLYIVTPDVVRQHCPGLFPVHDCQEPLKHRTGFWPLQVCLRNVKATLQMIFFLYNVVQICLRKHYTRKLHVQYFPIMQSSFCRKVTYEMLSWSAWINIAHENYLYTVGPQFTNNFAQENNLQFFIDLSSPTLH